MDNLLKDLRYGLRGLRKRPGFSFIVIVTLALGIGANTAIFTLVNAVLLKSIPVSNPDQLVLFTDQTGEGTSVEDSPRVGPFRRYSYASYQYLRNHNQSFEDLIAFRSGESRLSIRQSGAASNVPAQRGRGHLVSGSYFSLLGVGAIKGRVLTPSDDSPGAPPVAVISHNYWQRQLNSDPDIVGKNLILNGTSFTVVGVTPPEFFGVRVRRSPDMWLPLSFHPQVELTQSYLENNQVYWLTLMGRLKHGVTIEQAQAASTLTLQQFLTEQAGSQLNEDRQKGIRNTSVTLVTGGGGISGLRNRYSKPLQMLMAIVGMILLIVCANVGSLLLSRSASRKTEITMRMALGATRSRIMRQLLTESMLLAFIGGICGVVLSYWGVKLLVSLVTQDAPLDTRPDLFILSFTAGVSLLAGLLFGLVPAVRSSRSDLVSTIKEKSKTGSGRLRFNLSSGLVVVQVALSLVLLTGAGLFARSLLNLQKEEVGFNRANVLLVGIDPRLAGYKPVQLANLYQRLVDRLSSIPNVTSVTMATFSPMSGTNRTSSVKVQGYTTQPGENLEVQDLLTGPKYGETLGVPLLRGREINERDTAASAKIAVVNEKFVEHYFKGQNPIGRTFEFDDDTDNGQPLEIVGVIGNVKSQDQREQAEDTVYRPILQIQDEAAFSVSIHLRTQSDPASLAPVARQAINEVDDKLPIFDVTTLSDQMQERLQQDRLIAQLVSFFGMLALLLACIGLYGVMAQGVARRTNEIGIRIALGARGKMIIWMVLREVLLLVVVGLAIGVPVALLSTRFVSSQLFGLTGNDPVTLLGAAVILTFVAMLAGFIPARRASRVNPLIALRYE
ncbi:MAG: hypothetical protein DMF69_11570 [Acidobacteria bacterium]|nr:MAG: hypothetical protein DMF69_11570 [Acidobacteriota bacterium]